MLAVGVQVSVGEVVGWVVQLAVLPSVARAVPAVEWVLPVPALVVGWVDRPAALAGQLAPLVDFRSPGKRR